MDQKQGVQSGIIEAFTNQLAGSNNHPLLIIWNRSDFGAYILSLLLAHSASQHNYILGKSL
ncbi:hypothetical protein D3C73_1611860 [compost metagenome]